MDMPSGTMPLTPYDRWYLHQWTGQSYLWTRLVSRKRHDEFYQNSVCLLAGMCFAFPFKSSWPLCNKWIFFQNQVYTKEKFLLCCLKICIQCFWCNTYSHLPFLHIKPIDTWNFLTLSIFQCLYWYNFFYFFFCLHYFTVKITMSQQCLLNYNSHILEMYAMKNNWKFYKWNVATKWGFAIFDHYVNVNIWEEIGS